MEEITSLFSAVNASKIVRQPLAGSDIASFYDLGVPLGEPYLEDNNYFWIHHSDADWIDVLVRSIVVDFVVPWRSSV